MVLALTKETMMAMLIRDEDGVDLTVWKFITATNLTTINTIPLVSCFDSSARMS